MLAVAIVVVVATGNGAAPSAARTTSPPTTTTPTTSTRNTSTPTTSTPTTSNGAPAGRHTGPSPVGEVALTLTDGSRVLPTTVRYPATAAGANQQPLRAAKPYPLIVFSQGFAISPDAYGALLDAWAAAGFVVAAPAYPLTTPGGNEGDILNHPADLRAVITDLLAVDAQPGNLLSRTIDVSRIGIVGHSDGGDTTNAVAEGTCCHDSRVSAAIIMSGAELVTFGGSFGGSTGVPLLVTQGSADTVNLPACSQQIYNAAPGPRYYLSLVGAGHHAPYLAAGPYQAAPAAADAYQKVVTAVTIDFWDATLKGASPAALATAGNEPGVSELSANVPVVQQGTCPGAPAA